MKGKGRNLSCLFVFLVGMVSLTYPSQAKEIVKDYGELKAALEDTGTRQIELGADIFVSGSIKIRGTKVIDGRGHTLERSKKRGNVYGGTLFLMLGNHCEWKNVTISGAGKDSQVVGKVFGRLLEARRGKTIVGDGCVWKDNVNNRLAVDGGGALWIKKEAQCQIVGGEVSHNENVSCGAGIRVEKGAQLLVQSGRIANNIVRGAAAVEGFEGLGAAIYNEGTVTIKSGVLEKNKAIAYSNDAANYGGAGGAIYNRGDCIIMGGAIQNNFASQRGSAVYSDRCASLEICGGFLLANQDAEKRPLWVDGSCILGKKAMFQQIYIADTADVKVGRDWDKRQPVTVEPAGYQKGRCLLRGAKGNFILKRKNGYRLIRKNGGYYIDFNYIEEKKKSGHRKNKNINMGKEPGSTRIRGPQIVCERKSLLFYEGEYVSKEVLCYGVSSKDARGKVLSVDVKGREIKKGVLDTSHVGRGCVTYYTKDRHNRESKRRVTFEIIGNRKPQVKTAPRFFFLDEVEQVNQEKWKKMLWEGMHWQDDKDNREELKLETRVELGNFNKKGAGKYIVKGCVRDQYGHRYYMKSGERRRYGKGKMTNFTIEITVVERSSSGNGILPYIRFSRVTSGEVVEEEWHFSSKTILEIQQFMKQSHNPFSQETNQEFIRRYQACRRGGSARKNE